MSGSAFDSGYLSRKKTEDAMVVSQWAVVGPCVLIGKNEKLRRRNRREGLFMGLIG